MRKIIIQGKLPEPEKTEGRCTCRNCHTVFSFQLEDVQNINWVGLSVDCPFCRQRNAAEEIKGTRNLPLLGLLANGMMKI